MFWEFNSKGLFCYCTTAPQDDIGNKRRCRYFSGNYDLTFELILREYVLLGT
jgi:hypothetical protein